MAFGDAVAPWELSMEFELSGNGYLETPTGSYHRVRYFVRSYLERTGGLYDSYGRIEPDDAQLLLRLLIETKDTRFVLRLQDGSRLPVLLTSSSGSIRVQGSPELATR